MVEVVELQRLQAMIEAEAEVPEVFKDDPEMRAEVVKLCKERLDELKKETAGLEKKKEEKEEEEKGPLEKTLETANGVAETIGGGVMVPLEKMGVLKDVKNMDDKTKRIIGYAVTAGAIAVGAWIIGSFLSGRKAAKEEKAKGSSWWKWLLAGTAVAGLTVAGFKGYEVYKKWEKRAEDTGKRIKAVQEQYVAGKERIQQLEKQIADSEGGADQQKLKEERNIAVAEVEELRQELEEKGVIKETEETISKYMIHKSYPFQFDVARKVDPENGVPRLYQKRASELTDMAALDPDVTMQPFFLCMKEGTRENYIELLRVITSDNLRKGQELEADIASAKFMVMYLQKHEAALRDNVRFTNKMRPEDMSFKEATNFIVRFPDAVKKIGGSLASSTLSFLRGISLPEIDVDAVLEEAKDVPEQVLMSLFSPLREEQISLDSSQEEREKFINEAKVLSGFFAARTRIPVSDLDNQIDVAVKKGEFPSGGNEEMMIRKLLSEVRSPEMLQLASSALLIPEDLEERKKGKHEQVQHKIESILLGDRITIFDAYQFYMLANTGSGSRMLLTLKCISLLEKYADRESAEEMKLAKDRYYEIMERFGVAFSNLGLKYASSGLSAADIRMEFESFGVDEATQTAFGNVFEYAISTTAKGWSDFGRWLTAQYDRHPALYNSLGVILGTGGYFYVKDLHAWHRISRISEIPVGEEFAAFRRFMRKYDLTVGQAKKVINHMKEAQNRLFYLEKKWFRRVPGVRQTYGEAQRWVAQRSARDNALAFLAAKGELPGQATGLASSIDDMIPESWATKFTSEQIRRLQSLRSQYSGAALEVFDDSLARCAQMTDDFDAAFELLTDKNVVRVLGGKSGRIRKALFVAADVGDPTAVSRAAAYLNCVGDDCIDDLLDATIIRKIAQSDIHPNAIRKCFNSSVVSGLSEQDDVIGATIKTVDDVKKGIRLTRNLLIAGAILESTFFVMDIIAYKEAQRRVEDSLKKIRGYLTKENGFEKTVSGKKETYRHVESGVTINMTQVEQQIESLDDAAFYRMIASGAGAGTALTAIAAPSLALGPAGIVLVGLAITAQGVISVYEQKNNRDFLRGCPMPILALLGTSTTIKTSEHDVIAGASNWMISDWLQESGKDKVEIRKKAFISLFWQEIGELQKLNPEIVTEILQGKDLVEFLDENGDFFRRDYKQIIETYLSVRLYEMADKDAKWNEFSELRIDEGWFDLTNVDPEDVRTALRESAWLYVQHIRERCYRERNDEYQESKKVSKEIKKIPDRATLDYLANKNADEYFQQIEMNTLGQMPVLGVPVSSLSYKDINEPTHAQKLVQSMRAKLDEQKTMSVIVTSSAGTMAPGVTSTRSVWRDRRNTNSSAFLVELPDNILPQVSQRKVPIWKLGYLSVAEAPGRDSAKRFESFMSRAEYINERFFTKFETIDGTEYRRPRKPGWLHTYDHQLALSYCALLMRYPEFDKDGSLRERILALPTTGWIAYVPTDKQEWLHKRFDPVLAAIGRNIAAVGSRRYEYLPIDREAATAFRHPVSAEVESALPETEIINSGWIPLVPKTKEIVVSFNGKEHSLVGADSRRIGKHLDTKHHIPGLGTFICRSYCSEYKGKKSLAYEWYAKGTNESKAYVFHKNRLGIEQPGQLFSFEEIKNIPLFEVMPKGAETAFFYPYAARKARITITLPDGAMVTGMRDGTRLDANLEEYIDMHRAMDEYGGNTLEWKDGEWQLVPYEERRRGWNFVCKKPEAISSIRIENLERPIVPTWVMHFPYRKKNWVIERDKLTESTKGDYYTKEGWDGKIFPQDDGCVLWTGGKYSYEDVSQERGPTALYHDGRVGEWLDVPSAEWFKDRTFSGDRLRLVVYTKYAGHRFLFLKEGEAPSVEGMIIEQKGKKWVMHPDPAFEEESELHDEVIKYMVEDLNSNRVSVLTKDLESESEYNF